MDTAGRGVSRLCALPASDVRFDLQCIPNDTAVPGCAASVLAATRASCDDTTSRCGQQLAALRRCLLVRSQREALNAIPSRGRRARLLAALQGRRTAVVGDSMARQSWTTLVSLLRGDEIVVDLPAIGNSYARVTLETGSTIDLFGRAGTFATPGIHFQPSAPAWAERAGALLDETDRLPQQNESLRVDYVPHNCFRYANHTDSTDWQLRHALLSGKFDTFVLHAPAYWPLLGLCQCCGGHLPTEQLIPTLSERDNVVRHFWVSLSRDVKRLALVKPLRMFVVNAPTEHVGQYKSPLLNPNSELVLAAQVALNEFLEGLFASRQDLFPPETWTFIDWARLMRERRYASMGLEGHDWHYLCHLRGTVSRDTERFNFGSPPNGVLLVAPRTSADCNEQGNTALYHELIVPRHLPPTTTSSAAS
eukprot:5117176-Prymnesium_polylepis.1